MSEHNFNPNRSRWIPWVFVGGMLVVVVVNGVLIFSALNSFPGLSVSGSYDRGRTYNNVLMEAARQDALGWTPRVVQEGERLTLTVVTAAGTLVVGRLEAQLLRPLDGERVTLPEHNDAGHFVFDLPELRRGQWELRAVLTAPDGARRDIRHRFTLL